ncbi:MAG: hypothetical protein IV090_21030 [Candidatus Sericytochromatia bacterium]|nr:hypothetical protein [Candidatus Sericytochromatia bacterium]
MNKRAHDEQLRIFHIQVYLPASRISAIFWKQPLASEWSWETSENWHWR